MKALVQLCACGAFRERDADGRWSGWIDFRYMTDRQYLSATVGEERCPHKRLKEEEPVVVDGCALYQGYREVM